MQITTNNPVQIDIIPISSHVLTLKFLIKGAKDAIRIRISVIIYYKHPVHRNMVNVTTSETLNICTFTEDRAYKAYIKMPEFKDRTKSFISFSIDPNYGPYAKAFIEDIKIIGYSSQKIINGSIVDKSIIESVPIPIDPTINEMIERMINEFKNIKLPKDSKNRISYIYPIKSHDSFHLVAKNHIENLVQIYISNQIDMEIENIDLLQLANLKWGEKRNILIHPFLYPFVTTENFKVQSRNFAKLLNMKNKIGGFDVADSNKISNLAVDLVNRLDLMIVPSKFARDAYINSGVDIPVEILPHGIPKEFLVIENDNNINSNINIENDEIIKLRKLKGNDNILVLFFLIHSEHRKGADIVKEVMRRINKKFKNVYLIVKGQSSYYANTRDINIVNIRLWMDNNSLKSLYDICDICISPSRGGGFELNALEAVSRGIPTLVTNGGCFLDMIEYFIPIDLGSKVSQPLPGNPIHTGYCHDADINDFERKLEDTILRIKEIKKIFRYRSYEIREKYSWTNTAKKLDEYLREYEFVKI